jgi:Bifunctional DNA primase/polymerase, N-terminal
MNDLLKAALEYKQAGLSIIGVKNNKQSLHCWKNYQYKIMSDELLIKTFSHPAVNGIAVICGNISENLEMIEIDSKYDLTQTLFERYIQYLYSTSSELVDRLVIASTKNKGYHFYYRCTDVGKNTVLAKRHCSDTEILNNPDEKVKVLIETRGNGGYAIVYPTMGYRFIQHDLKNIPVIDPEQRHLLFTIARSFNLYQEPLPDKSYSKIVCYDSESPFADYDARGDVVELLEKHGWKVVRRTFNKTYFRRPGNTDHETSGDYNHQLGLFGVFSTSTDFEVCKGYRPYAVYTILECQGNFKLAAKRLLNEGYGTAYKDRW